MKDIFQLIIEACEGPDDMCSRLFHKRVSLFETVDKV